MDASTLIRVGDAVATPAPGRWSIAADQVVLGTRRDLGRRIGGRGRTLEGSLFIDRARSGSTMDLTIAVDDLPFPGASTLQYRAVALIPTPGPVWLLNGDLTAGTITRPLRAIVRYHGVSRDGDRAAASLTLHTRIDLRNFGARRPFAGRYLDLAAYLDAEPQVVRVPTLRRVAAGVS
jgi:hypothetical protein